MTHRQSSYTAKGTYVRKALIAVLLGVSMAANAAALKPEEVVASSLANSKAGDWLAVTRQTHPEALAASKALFRQVLVADSSGEVGSLFFGVKSLGEYDALSDADAYTALWQNLTTKIPIFGEALKNAEEMEIGSVAEGEDVVHVVYRESSSAQQIRLTKVSVQTLKRSNGEWKLMLSGSIDGLAARLAQFAKVAKANDAKAGQ